MKTINLSFDPKSFFKKILLLTLLSALFATCLSCSSTKHITQLVHDVHKDTCYLSNIRYDSIYINCEHYQEYHLNPLNPLNRSSAALYPDTVFIKDVCTEFRYKLLRDTIFKVQCDSIPYPVRVTEKVEVTRPPNLFDRLTHYIFWAVIVIIFVFVFRSSSFVLQLIRNIRQL